MATSPNRAIIIAGGEINTTPYVVETDTVFAADSGYDHAVARGITVDVLVGDLDSISPGGLDHARENGTEIVEHERNKDSTDLDLAIQLAAERGSQDIHIHGGEGGRIAHLLAIALSISSERWLAHDVTWHTGTGSVRAATPTRPVSIRCSVGQSVSLIPVGVAHDVTTHGLVWPLEHARLERGSSLGISNQAAEEFVGIAVGDGAVLVVREGPVSR